MPNYDGQMSVDQALIIESVDILPDDAGGVAYGYNELTGTPGHEFVDADVAAHLGRLVRRSRVINLPGGARRLVPVLLRFER